MTISLPRRRVLLGCASGLLAATVSPMARADDCAGVTLQSVVDPKAAHSVTVTFDRGKKGWDATWSLGSKVHRATLVGPGTHAHLVLAVVRDVQRFALVETSAGHELGGRIRVYDPRCNLVKSVGLEDIMTKTELAGLSRSISHLRWLEPPSLVRLAGDGKSLDLTLIGGRRIAVSLP